MKQTQNMHDCILFHYNLLHYHKGGWKSRMGLRLDRQSQRKRRLRFAAEPPGLWDVSYSSFSKSIMIKFRPLNMDNLSVLPSSVASRVSPSTVMETVLPSTV